MSKLVILLVGIIILLVLLIIGYRIYCEIYKNSPMLYRGIIDGVLTQENIALQEDGSKLPYKQLICMENIGNPLPKLEFGYSFWLYIDNIGSSANWEASYMKSKNILNRGNSPSILYVPLNNSLVIKIKTGVMNTEEFVLKKALNSQKWINVCVSLDNRDLDVYLNGELNRSFKLKEVPKLNFNDIAIFDGGNIYAKIAILRYFNYPLYPQQVKSIYDKHKRQTPPKENMFWWFWPQWYFL